MGREPPAELVDGRVQGEVPRTLQAVADASPQVSRHGEARAAAERAQGAAPTRPDEARVGSPSAAPHWSHDVWASVRQLGRERAPPTAQAAPVAQLMYTRARSVALDMHHREWDTIFADMRRYYYLWQGFRARWNTRGRVAEIVRQIEAGRTFSYARLSDDTLAGAGDLIDLDGADGEHMYVHYGNTIHLATRADDEKKPHPTLVGGDPDVTCAGTIEVESEEADGHTTYTVTITNESGHFRPADIPQGTEDRFTALAALGLPEDTTVEVETRER